MLDDSREEAEERLRAIVEITEAGASHLDVDDLLDDLLTRVTDLLGVDTAAVLLLDESGRQLIARAAHGVEEEVRQGVRVTVGTGFAGSIALHRRPIRLDRVDASTVTNPILWERGIQAMLGVPLLSGSRLLGVLHVGSFEKRIFTDSDQELVEFVAQRVAAATVARELEVERAAAAVLQRSLLPTAMPTCPGIEFATRYVPAEEYGVGGDWYDAFVLSSGVLWVMAGDIAGHGLNAAVVMGRLRSALRAYALQDHPPEKVLALADAKLSFFEPNQTATVLCARLDPPFETVSISSAGHPPPVLAVPGVEPYLVDVKPGLPLGVAESTERVSVTVSLPLGAVLLAYTDGLVERRGESLDAGFARVLTALKADHPEVVCREMMEQLVGRDIPRDDIALIAMRHVEGTGRPGASAPVV